MAPRSRLPAEIASPGAADSWLFDANLIGMIAARDCGSNTAALLSEADQLRLPLDIDADPFQLPDKESLVIVLCIRQGEGIGANAIAEILETDCCYFVRRVMIAAFANMYRFRYDPPRYHFVGEPELAVEFERAGRAARARECSPGPWLRK